MISKATCCFTICLAIAITAVSHAADWTSFLGSNQDGVAEGTGYPTEWSEEKNVKWKVELPSKANGSPIVSNGRVFLLSGNESGSERSTFCFDRATGEQLWVQTVSGPEAETHKTNPYCGSTPASDGKHVVVWHNTAGLVCYDFEGNELWKRELGQFEHMWGYGSSPIIHNDRVYLYAGPGERIFVTALELENGETIWETDEPQSGDGESRGDGKFYGSWTTPRVVQVDGADQLVCIMPSRINGYDLNSGEIIWSCSGLSGRSGDTVCASPMVKGDICIAMGSNRGPAIAFKMGGSGDITESNMVWEESRNPDIIGTGAIVDDYVYRANAGPGTIECVNLTTGKVEWRSRGAGGNSWASVVLADGLLYAINQEGVTAVFKPNPEEYDEVAQNALEVGTNATPAFSDQEIFIRTDEALYCITNL